MATEDPVAGAETGPPDPPLLDPADWPPFDPAADWPPLATGLLVGATADPLTDAEVA